jgi:hypothetical protein
VKVQRTGEHFSCYGSNNLRVKIGQPSCSQYKEGHFWALKLRKWDEMIDTNQDDVNRAHCEVPSSAMSSLGNGNDNDHSKSGEEAQGGETETGKRTGAVDRMGKGKGKG